MITYNPLDGDVYTKGIRPRPRTCFVMTKLGTPVPRDVANIRRTLARYAQTVDLTLIDAGSEVTGRDFLAKIWEMLISVPLGIAVICGDLTPATMSNIFYEIGVLQALGKETLVIKTKDCYVPSDFVRTEYIEYDRRFGNKILKFFTKLSDQAEYYRKLAGEMRTNPLLALDYLRRAYLITGDESIRSEIRELYAKSSLDPHSAQVLDQLLRS